jgi:hypothetical protein
MTDATIAELASGERRPLARLLTRIENGDPSVRVLLPDLFAAGRGAHVVGITGPLLALHARRDPRGSDPDDGARRRPRRVHAVDGLAR